MSEKTLPTQAGAGTTDLLIDKIRESILGVENLRAGNSSFDGPTQVT
jgi:hypothetical protein